MTNVTMIFNGHNVGGAELQFLELARHLNRTNDVTIIAVHGDDAVKHISLENEIPLFSFAYESKVACTLKLFQAVGCGVRCKPDVIISTSFIANALAVAIARFTKSRLLSMQTVSKAMTYPSVDRAILRKFDILIAGCTDIQEYLMAHGQAADKIKIVNNWVDFSARNPTEAAITTRQRLGIPEKVLIIGCVGRLHYQKGQEFLIRAFQKLAASRTGLKLLLVGDGPRMNEMQNEANSHPDVIFTGTAEGDDYNNLLNIIDIYVQPSRFEGLPRTLLDAMYMGKPVIASAVNGNLDAIQHYENGLLVPPEDVNLLEAAIQDLIQNLEVATRLGRRAKTSTAQNFSAEPQMTKIEELCF